MIAWLRRTLAFTRFTLQEYLRSGRILVELVILVAALWIFFWPRGDEGIDAHQFFNIGGILILALSIYTTAVMMGLGARPQGYIVLSRSLGRRGYLMGLYLAALTVIAAIFLLLTLSVLAINPPRDLHIQGWLLGALPLLLDVAILASFTMLIAPLVLSSGMRLLLLSMLAIALSTDVSAIKGFSIERVLRPLQTLISLPLLPAMSGFELAVNRNYNQAAVAILVGQVALTAALLAFALSAFDRRELMLTS
ncbi:MAG: hypothetical protein KatS3mg057_0889 [Herpetosiphonaceae bacterium]|nr:MAG: hypothetical protein KatS3mg057_0889 [Herpetosiphonaceae bacterium]